MPVRPGLPRLRAGPAAAAARPSAKDALEGEDDPRVPKDYLTQNLIGAVPLHARRHPRERATGRGPRASSQRAQAASPAQRRALLQPRPDLSQERPATTRRSAPSSARDAINPRHIASRSRVVAADKVREVAQEAERARALEREAAPRLAGAAPGTPEYHLRLADVLESAGEGLAARGHRLRAALAAAGR